MPPSLNCSSPNFDPKCFQVLGDYNPCHSSLNDEKYIALALLVLCFLVLLLQGLRTAKSIFIRMPKCAGVSRSLLFIRGARSNSDLKLCVLACPASLFFLIGDVLTLTSGRSLGGLSPWFCDDKCKPPPPPSPTLSPLPFTCTL